MIVAHVAGVPLEELLSLAPVAGVIWLALRVNVRAAAGESRR